MKFRSFFYLSVLFLGAVCCLTSCEDGTDNGTDEQASIYWNKSAAFKLQLKGKVKKLVTVDSVDIYLFNQSGNITSNIYLGQEERVYQYTNGRLTSETMTWIGESNSYTTTYTYGTSGKYLPIGQDVKSGLYRNIASIDAGYGTTRYIQSGDSMLIITTQEEPYTSMKRSQGVYADTISLTFNGGMFPVTLRKGVFVANITYATDGRILTVEEIFDYHNGDITSYLTTYKPVSEHLLPISIERKQNDVTYTTETFTYNENEDLVGYNDGYYQTEYSDYEYDAKGNWISRKHRHKGRYDDSWSEKTTETRIVEYWD